jgi:predicted HTH domain antitoxin
MQTVTLSMRLPRTEAARIDRLAKEMGMERPTFLKRALRRGARDMQLEQAVELYRQGQVTLSRAAEMAGLSLRDMIVRLHSSGLELHYQADDLVRDLRP